MRNWKAGDRCKLDGKEATVLCVHYQWAWVVKDISPRDAETVDLILLEE